MMVQHVSDAKKDGEFEVIMIKSEHYKTSMLYGAKLMVLPVDIYQLLEMYVKKLRPILTRNYVDKTGESQKARGYYPGGWRPLFLRGESQ